MQMNTHHGKKKCNEKTIVLDKRFVYETKYRNVEYKFCVIRTGRWKPMPRTLQGERWYKRYNEKKTECKRIHIMGKKNATKKQLFLINDLYMKQNMETLNTLFVWYVQVFESHRPGRSEPAALTFSDVKAPWSSLCSSCCGLDFCHSIVHEHKAPTRGNMRFSLLFFLAIKSY